MKFHKKYLVPIGFLFFFLAGITFANSSQFLSQAQKYVNDNCTKKKLDNQTALFCYLFNKVQEHDTAISNINATISPMPSEISDLQKRVSALETQIPKQTATPTLSPTPTLTPTAIPTPTILLDDEFNDTILNSNVWSFYQNSGTYYENNGFLNLPGGVDVGMPFFETINNPFPSTGSFTIEYGIQYTTISSSGDGLALNVG